MPDQSVLQGPERLEHFAPLQRPLRKGTPQELRLSDFQRAKDLLNAGDREHAGAFLRYLHPLNLFMFEIAYEWLLRWPLFVSQRASRQETLNLVQEAYGYWKDAAEQNKAASGIERQTLADLLALLAPPRIVPPALDNFLKQKETHEASALIKIMVRIQDEHHEILALTDAGRCPQALQRFETYFALCRANHDLMFQYIWALGSTILRHYGQAAAEEAVRESFVGCSFGEMMWALFKRLAPVERAAFLAEHLRNHFSGMGRQGSVEIIEEPDRYRLIFDPCGSGGHMRRALEAQPAPGFDVLPKASALTWNRAGEVPVYCAHCALNELSGVRHAGYPLWVTEFNPDPAKPCGWTVYKDPNLIPENYFKRIGIEKDPSKFHA